MPAISVIVPVYNVEKYLPRCIDSILAQTYTDFELILIDDGSPDSSGKICDDYAKKDTRIRVFHKENEGLALTRLVGVNNAKGEYLVHVDSDDYIEPNMLTEMYQCITTNNADVAIADFYRDNNNGKIEYHKSYVEGLSPKEILQNIISEKKGCSSQIWTKIFRKDLYNRYSVKMFKEINLGEDFMLMVQLFQHQEIKAAYIPKAFYHYVYNPTSYTNDNCKKENFFLQFSFVNKLKELLPPQEYDDDIAVVEKRNTKKLLRYLILYPDVIWNDNKGNYSKNTLLIKILNKIVMVLISIINKINKNK